jgi:murein DD-endopeptidase MepM/ murein hydrolase activator NlpD
VASGQSVKAGDIIGYMGDTGYSKTEGTTGNFPVHLHVGILYPYPLAGDEFWINPYVFLRNIEGTKAVAYE